MVETELYEDAIRDQYEGMEITKEKAQWVEMKIVEPANHVTIG